MLDIHLEVMAEVAYKLHEVAPHSIEQWTHTLDVVALPIHAHEVECAADVYLTV